MRPSPTETNYISYYCNLMDTVNRNRILVFLLALLSAASLFILAKAEDSPTSLVDLNAHHQLATSITTTNPSPADHPEEEQANWAQTYTTDLITNHKVVIFSKANCPYCVLAKDLFTSLGEAYETVELDRVENGKDIHQFLKELTGQKTVPNIFVNGVHLGGYTDTNAKKSSGVLQQLLN